MHYAHGDAWRAPCWRSLTTRKKNDIFRGTIPTAEHYPRCQAYALTAGGVRLFCCDILKISVPRLAGRVFPDHVMHVSVQVPRVASRLQSVTGRTKRCEMIPPNWRAVRGDRSDGGV